MNLFNIGVEGQYRMAAVVAAWAGAAVTLPKVLQISFIIAVAMLTGAAYASIPAVLKVTRGINEVITTIMLNSIAVALAAYLVRGPFIRPNLPPNTNPSTELLPESARMPGVSGIIPVLGLPEPSRPVNGFLFVAIAVGLIIAVVLNSSRFGFSLRASGLNLGAAAAGGIPAKRMVIQAMLLSGALAGLIGLPQILGEWSYAVYLGQTAWLLAIRFFEQRLYPAPDAIVLGQPFSSLIWWLEPLALVTVCVLWGGLLAEFIELPAAARLRARFGRRLDPQSIPTPS
jgi:ABC-type uncharacterized transport system permease subunit